MALDNYTNLKASIADWLARADMTAVIPDLITLAEGQMHRRFVGRVRQGLPIHEVRADKDKLTRSWVAQAQMEQGKVWFPPRSTPWYPEIEEELLAFPVGHHDDFVDTLSYAALHTARRSTGEVLWI